MADDKTDEKDPKDDSPADPAKGPTEPPADDPSDKPAPVGDDKDPKDKPDDLTDPTALQVLDAVASKVFKGEMVAEMSEKYPDVPKEIVDVAESKEQAELLVTRFRDSVKKMKQDDQLAKTKGNDVPAPLNSDELGEKMGSLKDSGKLEDFYALQARQHKVKLG